MENQKDTYSILPDVVKRDKRLTFADMVIYSDIISLSKTLGYCTAKNKYFAEIYDKSERQITRILSSLSTCKYITIEECGGKNRKIYTIEQPRQKCLTAENNLDKNVQQPRQKCLANLDKNVYAQPIKNINKNYNIKNKSAREGARTCEDADKYNSEIIEIINYMNKYYDTNYLPTTKETRMLITDKLESGFTVRDFKIVLDKKHKSWKSDAKMAQWLRPKTLFGDNFENYRNEQEVLGARAPKTHEHTRDELDSIITDINYVDFL